MPDYGPASTTFGGSFHISLALRLKEKKWVSSEINRHRWPDRLHNICYSDDRSTIRPTQEIELALPFVWVVVEGADVLVELADEEVPAEVPKVFLPHLGRDLDCFLGRFLDPVNWRRQLRLDELPGSPHTGGGGAVLHAVVRHASVTFFKLNLGLRFRSSSWHSGGRC